MSLIWMVNRFAVGVVPVCLVVLIGIAPQSALMQSAMAEQVTGREAVQKAHQEYQKGDLNGALQTLDTAIAIEPTYDLYVMRAQARLAAKKFPGVIEDAEAILTDRPGDPAGINLKLVALAKQDKVVEAIGFIDTHIASKPDVPNFPSAKAELLVTLILQGDEAIKKHDPTSSAFQLQKELRPAVNHMIAASTQPQQKQQARVFAANLYGRIKEYKLANSALTHAINHDKTNDPRLRMMRMQVRELWGNSEGVLEDLESLQANQTLKQRDPQSIVKIREQIELVREKIEQEKGDVYQAVLALRQAPSDKGRRDAVVAAVRKIEEAGENHSHYEELVPKRKVKPLYPEPTLQAIKQAMEKPDDVKLAIAADPVRSGSLHIIEAQNAAVIRPGAKERELIDRVYRVNRRLLARERKPVKDAQVRNRHTQVANLYPDHKAYFALAQLDYMTGNYESAERRAMLAAAISAVKLYEDPSANIGFSGVSIAPARALYRSAARLQNDSAEPIETAVAKAFWFAERGDVLRAGDMLEEAYALDLGDRDDTAPILNPILDNFRHPFNRRYATQLLDAYVNAALRAEQANEKDRYEQFIVRIEKRYLYHSHADSRVLLSEHARKSGDDKKAAMFLTTALSVDPMSEWANAVKGDRLSAEGESKLAMLHYNVAAGIGASIDQLKGISKQAGEKRDAIEQQLGLSAIKMYGKPIDEMRAENEQKHAGLIYAAGARILRDYPQNKNLLKVNLIAAFHMKDADLSSFTIKQLADKPVKPAIEPSELAWAHRLHGRSLIAGKNDYTGAVAAYTTSLEAEPLSVTYSARAVAFYHLHWYDEAISDATKVIEMKDATWSDYSVRAQSYEALGNLESAAEDIREALRLQKEAQGKNNFGLSNVAQRILMKNLNNLGGG